MPLVNMKLSKKEASSEAGVGLDAPDVPRFPHGLSLSLDDEVLSKLNMKELPDVGESKMLVAYVDVTDISESDSLDGKKRRHVRLQITDMSIEEKVKKDVLKTLYGNDKK